mmetsp:Transcript_3502/g.5419  ORF Transcript_3502/g.5419 Transcript_3502/m.5419 type:complete len:209 (+) Transcript_3502:3903-4529(+)
MAHTGLSRAHLICEQVDKAKENIIAALEALDLGWIRDPKDVFWKSEGRPLALADLRENLGIIQRRLGNNRAAKNALVSSLCTRYARGGGTGEIWKDVSEKLSPLIPDYQTKDFKKGMLPGISWVRAGLGRTCNNLGVALAKLNRPMAAGHAFEAAYGIMVTMKSYTYTLITCCTFVGTYTRCRKPGGCNSTFKLGCSVGKKGRIARQH